MTERNARPDNDVTRQLAPLVDDDAFITDLSRGIDPTDGEDDLAALLLELRDDVHANVPPTPVVEGADDSEATVIPMRTGRAPRPWLHGLIGAAAATVVIAGAGAVLLPPLNDDSDPTVVELASTLDELEHRAAEGDMDATRNLVSEARGLVRQLGSQNVAPVPENAAAPATETVTVTETTTASSAPAASEAPTATTVVSTSAAPVTVTETQTQTRSSVVTQTAVVTVTEPAPIRQNPLTDVTSEVPSVVDQAPTVGDLTPPQVQQ
ncbi:hypothetical protein [Corynebacterium guangdongense]|uniref:Anti-sigma-D factor RsdA sigma factor binding region domain-containing protein n=1 Tax=Corynebacterium guangdongense TaxID=1783348 RepID=A0ABU1ZW39_9CORY|nr:hypothetical protein [Corynebacterium guangdongense]MDR7328588.1 hypothetical protein [Corynebacterium guangdongense]WJZ17165.1 hypothetical protein CGUA_02845 [Corynebacterium guangdongense]